jgi:hypothetical protein
MHIHFSKFYQILTAHKSYEDTYRQLNQWIMEKVPDGANYDIILRAKIDILHRIESNIDNKETMTIVNDILDGDMYSPLRNAMFV